MIEFIATSCEALDAGPFVAGRTAMTVMALLNVFHLDISHREGHYE